MQNKMLQPGTSTRPYIQSAQIPSPWRSPVHSSASIEHSRSANALTNFLQVWELARENHFTTGGGGHDQKLNFYHVTYVYFQWRRAIEALEARAPPDGVTTMVNSLQNRVKSITLCVILNAKKWETVFVTLCIQIEWLFIILSGVKL